MKVAYKNLIEHLYESPSIDQLSNKLYQLGHEHEIHGDIFDMEFTPNRGDCLSLVGLARDLNSFYGKTDHLEIFEEKIDIFDFDFDNNSPDECPKISFLEIEVSDIASDYKPYLENYFVSLGHNKTNFFTDISNYISYELGQPTHCFDANKIKNKLIFENKECNSKFQTLLGTEIKLKGKNCVFSMDGEIISLAGVMGGSSTACCSKTRKTIVECAYFNPEVIVGKSIKYNLTSDAAHKFERGVDINCQEYILRRFLKIVQDHAKIKSIRLNSFSKKEFHNQKIPIDVDQINNILGIKLSESDYLSYLENLFFKTNSFIEVPSFRHDIKTQNDLAEEIARVIGYNNLPKTPINLKKRTEDKSKTSLIKSFLVSNGFSEVVNFPFTSESGEYSMVIDNPLDTNKKFLRTTLKESLIRNFIYNQRRQKDSIKLFEVSDIYTKNKELNYESRLGIIIGGRLGTNYKEFTKKLNHEYLHNLLNQNKAKDIFNIIEISSEELSSKKKDKVFYTEIALDKIPLGLYKFNEVEEKDMNFERYEEISEFPSSTRDLSFSISDLTMVEETIGQIENIKDSILKEFYIFDFYKNESKGIVKLGCRFIFQSKLKTLSDEEINEKIEEIINPIVNKNGIYIDGM